MPRLSRSSAGSSRTTPTKKALRTFTYAPVDDAESDHRNLGYKLLESICPDTSSASGNVNNRGKARASNERFCTGEPLSCGCSPSGTESLNSLRSAKQFSVYGILWRDERNPRVCGA